MVGTPNVIILDAGKLLFASVFSLSTFSTHEKLLLRGWIKKSTQPEHTDIYALWNRESLAII